MSAREESRAAILLLFSQEDAAHAVRE